MFVLLKLQFMCLCMIVGLVWPSRRNQSVVFGLFSMCNFGLSYCSFGVSFEGNCFLLVTVTVATWMVTYFPDAASQTLTDPQMNALSTFYSYLLVGITLQVLASIFASRVLRINARDEWRKELYHTRELEELRRILLDLVPARYARQLILGCAYIPCTPGRVVTLQLDLANFTVVSQTMSSTDLADTINNLFSDFDKCVTHRNLTKMDTIGDSYIVVSFVSPPPDEDSSDAERQAVGNETRERCLDMLMLAESLLFTLAAHRIKTGYALHGRIGIAVGEAISAFSANYSRASAFLERGYKRRPNSNKRAKETQCIVRRNFLDFHKCQGA